MSLRDFNSSSEDRPVILNHEPMGNGGGLGAFHTVNPEDREPNNTPKIIGALAVALMVGAAGAYVYSMSGKTMQPAAVQTASNIPAPAPVPPAPQPVADTTAPAPAADATTAMTPAAPAPDVKSASTKPVSTKRTASADMGAFAARMAADTSQPAPFSAAQTVTAPQQTAQVPEPVSPTAPSSSMASNTPAAPADAAPLDQAPAPAQAQPTVSAMATRALISACSPPE